MISKVLAALKALLIPERIDPLPPEPAAEKKSLLGWILSRETLPYDPPAEAPRKTLLGEILTREKLED